MRETALGIVALILLLYPLKTGAVVSSVLQLAICCSLTSVGVALGLSYFIMSNPFWISFASLVSAIFTLIVPSVGALVGLGTSAGLLAYTVVNSIVPSSNLVVLFVASASVAGMSSLLVFKDLFLHWQLLAPPVVGGYLASQCMHLDSDVFHKALWTGLTLISVALHVRRRWVNRWLERKQNLAVHSKESQIVHIMRSAKPDMREGEFDTLKEKLLAAVEGDREQVDRILFGGGLY